MCNEIIVTITHGIKAYTPVTRLSVTKEDIINAGRIRFHEWDSKEDLFSQWKLASPDD